MIGEKDNVLIVGLGLIGGSYAKGLRPSGCNLMAITRSQSTIDYALAHDMIDEGTIEEDSAMIGKADLIIFGLYPHTMIEWVRRNQQYMKPGALLTDVSGVKSGVIDVIQSFLRKDVEFIGSHPMAGREVYGVQNSDAAIFHGANFIVTPTEQNTPEAIAAARSLAQQLGFGRITELSLEDHDKMIGFVSQLTHAVAVSLMNTNDDTTHLKDYTGDSFRDLTRIAKINETMWAELFFLNKKNLVGEIDDFIAALEELKDTIVREDTQAIKKLFIQSTQRRKQFDK
ncbi:MAG: prephenate dehydrogenase [Oscillospiraceae bacterium]|nr:prephenate dehydrogenase [Oscillospiraceae bacterium]